MKYNKIETFKYVTNKILPSVYDDSLSYSELLAKVISYLNTTITNVDEFKNFLDDFIEKYDAKMYGTLKIILDDMIEKGDFQDFLLEVLGKLDKFVEESKKQYDVFVVEGKIQVDEIKNTVIKDLNSRGVNLESLGFKFDGSDESDKLQSAIDTYHHVIIPNGKVVSITKPIVLSRNRTLEGVNSQFTYDNAGTIKWIGSSNNRECMVQLGSNKVGQDPVGNDASSVVLQGIKLDGDYKVGIGVYGTYLTNQSIISNVHVTGTNEYGFFIAKGWYFTINSIVARKNNGNGISLGLPLQYNDGSKVVWSSNANTELNAGNIKNLRAHSCGEAYSNNANTHNMNTLDKGFGIGIGQGYNLNIDGMVSEGNGGVGLYLLNEKQQSRNVFSNGYLENNCLNSSVSPRIGVVYEYTNATAYTWVLDNFYLNPNNGIIYHKGLVSPNNKKILHIKNMSGIQNVLSSTELSRADLSKYIYSEDSTGGLDYSLAQNNMIPVTKQKVNTRYSFEILLPELSGGMYIVYGRKLGEKPYGSIRVNNPTTNDYVEVNVNNLTDELTLIGKYYTHQTKSITKGGTTGDVDEFIELTIMWVPRVTV